MGKKGKKSISKKTAKLRQTNKQIQDPPNKARKLLKFLTSTKAIVSFLIGVVGFLFAVWPRISVYPGESLDPNIPFATPFLIKNDGYLPIRDVHYSLTPRDVKVVVSGGGIGTLKGKSDKVFFIDPSAKEIPILESNRTTAIFAPFLKNVTVRGADIYINLTYKPYFVPYTFSEKHRFITSMKKTGEYVWLEDYGYSKK